MNLLAYFNGVLLKENEVSLPLNDRGYLFGQGLFETMRASSGFIPFLPEHLTRLYRGIDILKIPFDVSASKLQFAVYQTLFHNQLRDAYVRLILTPKSDDLGSFAMERDSNLVILVRPLKPISEQLYQKGASANLEREYRVHPDALCQLKTSNFLRNVLALEKSRAQGYDEPLLLNTEGALTEGATTNLFVYHEGRWKTPALDQGCMAGTTRRVILDLLEKNRVPVSEGVVTVAELEAADEAFLCNAIREIVPLTRWEGKAIGQGEVGEGTRHVVSLFREEIQFRYESFESKTRGVKQEV